MLHPVNPRGAQPKVEIIRFTVPADVDPFRIGEGYTLKLIDAVKTIDLPTIEVYAEAHTPRSVGRIRTDQTGTRICFLCIGLPVPRGGRFVCSVRNEWAGAPLFLYEVAV